MKTFITEKPQSLPIKVRVHERGEYDLLDAKSEKKGYKSIEPTQDTKLDSSQVDGLAIGMQNQNLHCGWICTFDDRMHKAMDMLELLKKKMDICKQNGEDFIVGFCVSGSFAVGYTLYTKGEN